MVFTKSSLSPVRSAHRVKYQEWDLPLRLPLVVVVCRIHIDHLPPETGFLVRIHFLGSYPHLAVSNLDRGVGVGLQVQVPGRVCGRAAFGGDDHIILAVQGVEKRGSALPAALTPQGIEYQDRTLAHTS